MDQLMHITKGLNSFDIPPYSVRKNTNDKEMANPSAFTIAEKWAPTNPDII